MPKTTAFLLGMLLPLSATTSFADMITNGSFGIAGTMFVTDTGGVSTPAGVCPAGLECLFFQDTLSPAINDKIDIAPSGLPNGDIPLAIAGTTRKYRELDESARYCRRRFSTVSVSLVQPWEHYHRARNRLHPAGFNGAGGCSASPPAAGQTCTPPGSLFNLQNLTATSSSATWRFQGITNDSIATWTGIFSSQFSDLPFQTAIANLAANGFVSNTFSGEITLTLPEPGTLSFLALGAGMIACAIFLRRVSRL